MNTETAIVMIVGIVALTTVRFIVALVGRDFSADHDHPVRDRAIEPRQVRRGTGRQSHLLYFEPAPVSALDLRGESTLPQAS